MRPLEMKIRGINSFREETVIDFDTLTKYGLFGIFGPTGSGKTTILDGLTLALYGETARKNANCIHTGMDTAGVSLRFEVQGSHGGIYVAERAFRRDKKSGNRISGKCCLYKFGEEQTVLADSTKEMNRCCRELIGMDYEDFSRTIVLPQGKFSEFLSLSGREKNEMLQRLFGLEAYGDVLIQKIRSREQKEKEILDHLTGEWQSYVGISREQIQKKKEIRARIQEEQTATEEKQAEWKACLQEQEEIWGLQKEQEENEKKLAALEKQSEKMHMLELRLQVSEKAGYVLPVVEGYETVELQYAQSVNAVDRGRLMREQAEEDYTQSDRKAFAACMGTRKSVREKLEKERMTCEKLTEDYDGEKEKRQVKQVQAEQLMVGFEMRRQIQEGVLLEQEFVQKQEELKRHYEKISRLQKQEEEARGDYAKAKQRADEAKHSYAYMLAAELKPGMPCPVCGHIVTTVSAAETDESRMTGEFVQPEKDSPDQERKALEYWVRIREEHRILREMVENLEGEVRKLEERIRKKRISANGINSAKFSEKKVISVDKAISLEGQTLDFFRQEAERIREQDEKRDKCEQSIRKSERQMEQIRSLQEEKKEQIRKMEHELAELERLCLEFDDHMNSGQVDTEKSNLENCLKLMEICREKERILQESDALLKQQELLCRERKRQKALAEIRLQESLGKAGFASAKEVRDSCFEEAKLVKNREELEVYRTTCQHTQSAGKRIRELLHGRSIVEEELLESREQSRKLAGEREQLIRQDAAIQNELLDLEERIVRKEELEKTIRKQEKQMEYLHTLQKLFAGKKFVQYIAAERLAYISGEASELLDVISNGRFGLETDETGNFIIRDYINGGAARSVFSLSGGETFLVSLALALALSTQIQMKNDAVLDFFFLDEGFGTLDEELLNEVMETLERLQSRDRVIGLISHVSELKERVPAKLLVSPPEMGGSGSHVKLEIG